VRCGGTVTTDTTLHADLTDCQNNGIVIGADDITVDLHGHTIDGDGTLAGCPVVRASMGDLVWLRAVSARRPVELMGRR
jgi:hypothetical protein